MFMRTRHLLKRLKRPLVSLVRVGLDVANSGKEVLGDVPAIPVLSPGQGVFKIVSRFTEGEVGVALPLARQNKRGGGHGLIQRIPNVLDSVGPGAPEILREVPNELYFQLVKSSLCVEINAGRIGLAFHELFGKRIELLGMTVTTPERKICAFERITHHG